MLKDRANGTSTADTHRAASGSLTDSGDENTDPNADAGRTKTAHDDAVTADAAMIITPPVAHTHLTLPTQRRLRSAEGSVSSNTYNTK